MENSLHYCKIVRPVKAFPNQGQYKAETQEFTILIGVEIEKYFYQVVPTFDMPVQNILNHLLYGFILQSFECILISF